MWWIRMLFHSLESSALPFPGDQDSLLRSWPSCAPSTLGRDLSVWRRGHLVPLAFSDAARVPEAERLEAILLASLREVASFLKLTPVPLHVLLCFLAATSPARDVSPIHWTDYTCIQSQSRWRRSPSVIGCSVSFPRRTRVTYVTQRRFHSC